MIYALAICFAIAGAGCHGKKGNHTANQVATERQELEQLYHIADSIYYKCGRIDTGAFSRFINKATLFVDAHPNDSIASIMLYRAGIGSMILAKASDGQIPTAEYCKKAIAIFNKFQKTYPDDPLSDFCFYQRGIIYDDILHDWNSAEVEYKDYINRHKEDSLAIKLSQYIQLLGKSEAEINEALGIK